MTTAAVLAAPADTASGVEGRSPRRRSAAWLGLAPFGAYVLLFLAIPAILAVGTGFFDSAGHVTFANFAALGDSYIQLGLWNSLWISAVTSVLGAVLGALICYALIGAKSDGRLRTIVDSASSVLAQFGGVMLAFAFTSAIGIQGFVTKELVAAGWLQNPFVNFSHGGPLLYQVPGLILPYLYFQVPLMVLTFLPAMEGLKTTWAEANATLGGTRLSYWTRIGMPVLAPAFFGSLILLFANAFSSYATASALIPQAPLLVLDIKGELTSETVIGLANTAGVLALTMVIVMVILMSAYSALQRRASRWQR